MINDVVYLLGLICLALIWLPNSNAATTSSPTANPTAYFANLTKEVVKERLVECKVAVYKNEPKKKELRIKVLGVVDTVKNAIVITDCETEAGKIFKKLFYNSKLPVKIASVTFLSPSTKKMVYQIVLSDLESRTINWKQLEQMEFSLVARYVWPLPDGACTGFGQI